MTPARRKPARVVVVGGGFGGLYAALTLQNELLGSELADVTLLDRRNYFTFTPLLPEVAAGTLSPAHVSYPFRLLAKNERFHFLQAEVIGFDLQARILLHFDRELAEAGQRELQSRGIEVRLGTRVTGATADEVELDGGADTIATRTLIWTGGTTPNPALARLPVAKTARGAAIVDACLRVQGYPEVYVVGDGASALDPRRKQPYPPVAPVAIHQGVRAAGNIVNALEGRPAEPFRFDFTGNIVGLGGRSALVNLLGLKFHGRLGWWFYRLAYLQRLVGMRNKVSLVLTLGLNAIFDRDISCET